MVEELFPGAVSLVSEVDSDYGVVFWSYRFFDQLHSGLLGRAPALLDVASGASTDNIRPRRFPAQTSRDDVVQRKLARGITLAAILAFVLIAGEDVPPIELHLGSRQPIVEEQPNYPRHRDMKTARSRP